MEKKDNFRRRVMKYAWQIWRNAGRHANRKSWRMCLMQAWANYRLLCAMKVNVVEFYFKKLDGTIRRAFGTLKGIDYKGTGRKSETTYKTITFYDTENEGFRCYRVENLLGYIL